MDGLLSPQTLFCGFFADPVDEQCSEQGYCCAQQTYSGCIVIFSAFNALTVDERAEYIAGFIGQRRIQQQNLFGIDSENVDVEDHQHSDGGDDARDGYVQRLAKAAAAIDTC